MIKKIYQVAIGIAVCLGFVACNCNQATSNENKSRSSYQIKVTTPPPSSWANRCTKPYYT